jgi:hypothetical protein
MLKLKLRGQKNKPFSLFNLLVENKYLMVSLFHNPTITCFLYEKFFYASAKFPNNDEVP